MDPSQPVPSEKLSMDYTISYPLLQDDEAADNKDLDGLLACNALLVGSLKRHLDGPSRGGRGQRTHHM